MSNMMVCPWCMGYRRQMLDGGNLVKCDVCDGTGRVDRNRDGFGFRWQADKFRWKRECGIPFIDFTVHRYLPCWQKIAEVEPSLPVFWSASFLSSDN